MMINIILFIYFIIYKYLLFFKYYYNKFNKKNNLLIKVYYKFLIIKLFI